MDLLFKRYASPLLFLEGLIEMDMVDEGLASLFEHEQEDLTWQLYLNTHPKEKSFNEWKKDVMQSAAKSRPLTDEQLKAALNKSQDILQNITMK